MSLGFTMTNDQFEDLLYAVDTDGSGEIDIDEFEATASVTQRTAPPQPQLPH